MPIYRYTAKNEHGETVKGKVEARNTNQAASALIGRSLLVIDIKSISETSFSYLQSKMMGVKLDDIVNFTRQLSTMIGAGLPLATSLSILQEQSKPAMSAVVTKLLKDVESGNSFAKALQEHPDVFSRVYIQLVRAGEAGGVLENVLDRLAITLEKQKGFAAKTKGTMIYPIIVLVAMVAVGFIMMIFVMPQMTEMYKDFGAELPLPTKILIAISDFMANFWWLIIMLAIGGFIAFRTWIKTKPGEKMFDEIVHKIPIIGNLRTKITLTEFARTLSLLLSSGVSLLEALDIVGEALNSVTFRNAVIEAKKEIERGVNLSTALEIHEVFPPILPQMISVGEETGQIDEILEKLSEYYEKESEYAVKNLTTAVEPVIMIILGLGVGFMVISIIMPIYNLTAQF
ncbi:MAG: Type IV fimbrial assembly protein PilC [Microgenomates bacterium 39_7]|nr:MAG: Type IV fimbrial assembly protein PilC [Microgenomates bacterium 39_7]